jgi:PAS domain S-box-containing protein
MKSALRRDRRFLLVGAAVYMLWWFAVEALLPGSFNPFGSRVAVVLALFAVWALSYAVPFIRERLTLLFQACLWLITLHYFYLFYGNSGEINWVIGAYITVMAISFAFESIAALLTYSVFVTLLSAFLIFEMPPLTGSIFFPGLVTILIQANLGLSARLRMIKTLGESNARFQQLFNSTFEGVLVHEEGVIVDANQALAAMSGYTREELIGMRVFDILVSEHRPLAAEKMMHAEVPPFEAKGLRKDGGTVDIEIRAKSFRHASKLSRLVTVQDLTDRKRVERERIETMAMTENVRVRDEFISMASHELKTPLTSLSLQTQMIERDLKRNAGAAYTPERLGEVASLYSRQIKRLTELVEAMLDVSRISRGKLPLHPRNFDLAQLVRGTLRSPQYQNVSIECDLPASIEVEADASRIEQVVENLVGNAVKYGDGKPIKVRAFAGPGETVISVEDSGLGIGEEYLPKIFERFERAVSSRSIAGLGLGLYISRQIVEAHGGKISVESRLGQGSKFTVRLPVPKSRA